MAEEKNEPHPEKFRFDINPSLTDISACESLSRKLRSSHGRRQTADLLSDEELTALQWALIANPESGDLIRGSGGLRKLRWAGSGRGKRGGLRVIYYWHVSGSVILLLLAYPKNEQENLSTDQLKILKSIIENEFP
jgi:mRNA-degrading endonuclease RelE of RelBE toxin-antitoxin system